MTNLELYRKDIEYYIERQGYSLTEALDQIYDEQSQEKRIYPKSLDDVNTMIKQDIRVMDWLAKGIDKGKRNNFQKHLKEIKELIKEDTIEDAIMEVYGEYNECEVGDYDMEVLEWLLKDAKV